jgi:hypothetical protein
MWTILAAILALAISGETLVLVARPSHLGRRLLVKSEIRRAETLMLNFSPEQIERVRSEAQRRAARTFGPLGIGIQLVQDAARWVLLFLELWLLLRLLTQFAGGEEQEIEGRPRAGSRYLVLFSLLPPALAQLAKGVVLSLSGGSAFEAAATYTEFRAAATVQLSLLSVAGVDLTRLPPVWSFLISNATNPFVWWAGYILVVGSSVVFRMSAGRSSLVAAALLPLLALQHAALVTVGSLVR